MPNADWSVEDVAGLLRDQDDSKRKCCLLIGAGVSRSAGVGTSADFVELIKAKHPIPYARAQRGCNGGTPTYVQCMDELTEGQQAVLVRDQVERAQINWAHIGIARLEAAEYVDRILTTNFDPLASRACALFNQFPAVYDLAALRDTEASGGRARFVPSFVRGSAIYHLHGQHTGFMLLNTQEKLELQAKRIEPALEEAVDDRVVIVCGYSGENDPLVDRLSHQDVFPHGLIWVCHEDGSPCTEVFDKLINRIDDCHLIRNMSADKFFTDLANALDLPQPPFLIQPFQHMLTMLNHIRPYSDLTDGDIDLIQYARNLLVGAESGREEISPDQTQIAELMAQGRYEEILQRYGPTAQTRSDSEKDLITWAATMWGGLLIEEARQKNGLEAEALFTQAEEKFAAALTLSPGHHEGLNNWGTALVDHARLKQGKEAQRLLAQAEEKYIAALELTPNDPEKVGNWGIALVIKAGRLSKSDREPILRQAEEKLTYAHERGIKKSAYDLACVAALRGDAQQAAKWLQTAKTDGALPNCDFIRADADFTAIRNSPAFVDALRDVGC